MVERFVAINELPFASEAELRKAFERVTETAHHLGIRPVETFYSLDHKRAYTYLEGDSSEHVREAFEAAGVPLVDVMTGAGRLYTELLDEPHRYR